MRCSLRTYPLSGAEPTQSDSGSQARIRGKAGFPTPPPRRRHNLARSAAIRTFSRSDCRKVARSGDVSLPQTAACKRNRCTAVSPAKPALPLVGKARFSGAADPGAKKPHDRVVARQGSFEVRSPAEREPDEHSPCTLQPPGSGQRNAAVRAASLPAAPSGAYPNRGRQPGALRSCTDLISSFPSSFAMVQSFQPIRGRPP